MQQLDPGKVGLRVPVSCKWKWKGHKTKPKVLNLGKELVEMVALIRLRMEEDKEIAGICYILVWNFKEHN